MINEWWMIGALAGITLALILYTQGQIWWSGLRAIAKDLSASPAVLHGNGRHDDAPGLRAWLRGEPVRWAGGAPVERRLHGCIFRVDSDWLVADVDSPRWLLDCTFVYPDGRDVVTRGL